MKLTLDSKEIAQCIRNEMLDKGMDVIGMPSVDAVFDAPTNKTTLTATVYLTAVDEKTE